jgi:hypothetical protein
METAMSIQVSWGNTEKAVIHSVFGEDWTLEEYHAMIDEMYKMITSVKHTVHTINDFSNNRSSPTKLLSTGRHVENRKAGNNGVSVIVNANPFSKPWDRFQCGCSSKI